jgi:hypothetical protein
MVEKPTFGLAMEEADDLVDILNGSDLQRHAERDRHRNQSGHARPPNAMHQVGVADGHPATASK